MKVLQERLAPRYSGIDNNARKKSEKQVVFQVKVPPQKCNYANNQVTLTVWIGSKMLCAVAMHQKHNLLTWGQDQYIIDIRREPTYWCMTVESRDQWDHDNNEDHHNL